MKKITIIGLIVGLIILGAVIGALLTVLFPLPEPPVGGPGRPGAPNTEDEMIDYEWFYTVKTVLSCICITLILALLFIYVDIFKKIKSKFTIGLIVIMFALLMYAVTSNPVFHRIFGYRAYGLGPFAMLPDLFTALALTLLLYLSLE